MAITPNREQFVELASAPDDGPVVMLNLLAFKERADGPAADGDDGETEYRRYGDAALKMVEERGGTVLWAGRADQTLIGDPSERWDQVVLVQYPSRAAFIDMVTQPEYEQAHTHRESGLARTLLLACTPSFGARADDAST
jgi:uncharacterized protein (DUF1330 family)